MFKALLFSLVGWLPVTAAAETVLLMAEEPGCYWCAKWDDEISHIYPKTAEGRAAPLQRFDLKDERPDVTFEREVIFTPTFILVHDGVERGRIEGYPGAEFFWGLLGQMFEQTGITLKQTG